MRLLAEIREAGGVVELLPTGELKSRGLSPEHKARVMASRVAVVEALQDELRRGKPLAGSFQGDRLNQMIECLERIKSLGHEVDNCNSFIDLLLGIQSWALSGDWELILTNKASEAHELANKILSPLGYHTGQRLAQEVKVAFGSSEIDASAFD